MPSLRIFDIDIVIVNSDHSLRCLSQRRLKNLAKRNHSLTHFALLAICVLVDDSYCQILIVQDGEQVVLRSCELEGAETIGELCVLWVPLWYSCRRARLERVNLIKRVNTL